MQEIEIVSTLDRSLEKSLFYCPENASNVPLLVGLHTWSFDRFNQVKEMLPRCQQRSWALLLPEFRGCNMQSNPRAAQACASRLARQDIIDAMDAVCAANSIDPAKIFMLGGSGGGHMALMTAAYAPQRWLGVSSWVPITDLKSWYKYHAVHNENYRLGVESCCGGAPGSDAKADTEYFERSPINYIEELKKLNLSVHHGRHDRSVPYTQSSELINKMEAAGANKFYFEIFDGGHECRYDRAFDWFESLLENSASQALTG